MRKRLGYVMLGAMVVVISVVAAVFTYQLVTQQSASQPSTVTWRDSSGTPIASITLTYGTSAISSETISFTCGQSLGPVALVVSSSLRSSVSVSPSEFSSCSSAPAFVRLAVTPARGSALSGDLHVYESDAYVAVSGTLNIQVLAS